MTHYRVSDGPRFEVVDDADPFGGTPAQHRALFAAFFASVSEPPAPALDSAGRLLRPFVPAKLKLKRKRTRKT